MANSKYQYLYEFILEGLPNVKIDKMKNCVLEN